MPQDAVVEVAIVPMAVARTSGIPFNRFAPNRVIPSALYFTSVKQDITVVGEGVLSKFAGGRQVSRFSGFAARSADEKPVSRGALVDGGPPDMGALSDPVSWRDVAVEVIVRSSEPGLAQRMWTADSFGGWDQMLANGDMLLVYDLSPDMRAAIGAGERPLRLARLPCLASMELRINDRIVARAGAVPAVLDAGSNPRRELILVKFPVVPADAGALPTYGAKREMAAVR